MLGPRATGHKDQPVHARKLLLTDDTALIVGSQNLSTASLLESRELSLTLDTSIAPAVIAAAARTFDTDYTAAPPAQQSSR